MKPSRPYLIRALYEWIVDNNMTPYLLVDAELVGVRVPREHVNNGSIVLNMAPDAVEALAMTNQKVSFSARFARGHFDCSVPIVAVQAIYASENGKGMFFSEEDLGDEEIVSTEDALEDDGETGAGEPAGARTKPHLTLVK